MWANALRKTCHASSAKPFRQTVHRPVWLGVAQARSTEFLAQIDVATFSYILNSCGFSKREKNSLKMLAASELDAVPKKVNPGVFCAMLNCSSVFVFSGVCSVDVRCLMLFALHVLTCFPTRLYAIYI